MGKALTGTKLTDETSLDHIPGVMCACVIRRLSLSNMLAFLPMQAHADPRCWRSALCSLSLISNSTETPKRTRKASRLGIGALSRSDKSRQKVKRAERLR